MQLKLSTTLYLLVLLCFSATGSASASNILFTENFEGSDIKSRGWYDNTSPKLSSIEKAPGSSKSLEFHFSQGATLPESGPAMRKKFPETDSVYISYYVKYSANWEGSNVGYHPHEFYLLTNKEGDWAGPAYSHLTVYLEQNEGKPQIGIQDGVNVDMDKIGIDLSATTENRAVAGCNGDSDGYGKGDCYASGSVYRNGKMWKADQVLFSDASGPYYKNDWHQVEAYIKLNSIANEVARKDGVLQYWFDGELVMNYDNVVFRTAKNSDMKFNQLLIGPYIGVGSPLSQSFWIDNLLLATQKETTGETTQVSPPENLRILSNL